MWWSVRLLQQNSTVISFKSLFIPNLNRFRSRLWLLSWRTGGSLATKAQGCEPTPTLPSYLHPCHNRQLSLHTRLLLLRLRLHPHSNFFQTGKVFFFSQFLLFWAYLGFRISTLSLLLLMSFSFSPFPPDLTDHNRALPSFFNRKRKSWFLFIDHAFEWNLID